MTVVTWSVEGRVANIRLNRPEKRNAINGEVTDALDEAFNRFEDDPDLWVAVLGGSDEFFCAGTDLADGSGTPTERGGEYGVIRRQRKKPLIAAVEGWALGGGFELAMVADLVVASEEAMFALPEVKRGVVASSGGLFRVVQRFPRNIAIELITTGLPMSAARAKDLGFVNRLCAPGNAFASAGELAASIAENAPVAVSSSLQAVYALSASSDQAGWQATEDAVGRILETDDRFEGINAFLEKRSPVWKAQ